MQLLFGRLAQICMLTQTRRMWVLSQRRCWGPERQSPAEGYSARGRADAAKWCRCCEAHPMSAVAVVLCVDNLSTLTALFGIASVYVEPSMVFPGNSALHIGVVAARCRGVRLCARNNLYADGALLSALRPPCFY